MKDLITGAEALMRSLEHQGVTTIFGYPGGSIMPVFDALYDHQNILNHILVRHEQGYIVADENGRTSLDNFFAAGDVRSKENRQIITAAADGANAAISAEKYLTARI